MMYRTGLFTILLPLFSITLMGQIDVPERGFVSSSVANTWEEGLLSGNGMIGANVLSRPLEETVIFSHERMFLPMGLPPMPDDHSARLFEIRRLIEKGLYRQAAHLQYDLSGLEDYVWPDPFVPAFDLGITMNTGREITDFVRSVDFRTGEVRVHWSDERGTYDRRLFVSRADGLALMKISGSASGIIDCDLQLKRRFPSNELESRYLEGTTERFTSHITDVVTEATGTFLNYSHRFTFGYPGSVHKVEGTAGVFVTGGRMETTEKKIKVRGADEVLVVIDLELLYDPDATAFEEMQDHIRSLSRDYEGLKKTHADIHGEMFSRTRLDLGGGRDHLKTTEELFAISSMEKMNRALIEKEFDAGRYNIISSTGELPPNLQGVWAGTLVPDWSSDYTHNGNVPSAIASMLMGNLPELMLAYTSYIESLVPWMEINARHQYGSRGVVLPHRTSTNGLNISISREWPMGAWVGGAAWAAHFFYDYYLYTGDREFLLEHALPFMKKAAVFFEDYLYEGPHGKWIFSPTQSPENTPTNANSQMSFNATSEVAMTKELLVNLVSVSKELNINQDEIGRWEEMLTKMPDYLIAENGMIKEWLTPQLENNDEHRHSSQIYPLYDGLPLEIDESPELREAFRKSIEFKLDTHWRGERAGFMSFGLVQLGMAAASLGEADLAYECLQHLVNRFWLNNLASMHNHKTLLNTDISGGQPAVVIKMLVDSQPGKIRLLPALPAEWSEGAIEGVLCRGQIEIERLEWSEGGLTINLISRIDQELELEVYGISRTVQLHASESVELKIQK